MSEAAHDQWRSPSAKRLLLTGATGFLGRAVEWELRGRGQWHIFKTSGRTADLRRSSVVRDLYSKVRPHIVIHLACPFGGSGIGYANAHPAELATGMLRMDAALIGATREFQVETFIGVGSVCSYPLAAPLPATEADLWNGHPEPVNGAYGQAKRMQLTLLQAARKEWGLNGVHLILANLYGPGDHFGTGQSGHVIPSTIVKCVQAREAHAPSIVAWGDGSPTRSFLYVDDAARAIRLALEQEYNSPEPLNICSAEEVSIKTVVERIAALTQFRGDILWDASQPGGQPRRLFSGERAKKALGWTPEVGFGSGLDRTVRWYEQERREGRAG